MSDNNEKLKWLKPLIQLFIFCLLTCTVYADNSTDYTDDDDMATFVVIQPAPEEIPQCGVNEVYQSCEVDCIDCEHRGMCEPKNCHVNHCDCKLYFVHVTPGGPCEHVSACPPRECPENEVYRHCASFCEYCDMAPCRELECTSRCYCKPGYRRNRQTGKCVTVKECPERLSCFANDELAQNGTASEYCLPTEYEAKRVNETIEEEKCYCPDGYKRNIHGWCIEEDLCEYVQCYGDTVFQDCPKKCNSTCWNYGDPTCEEDGQCYPACFCPDGFVLNEYFACIRLEECPPGSNPFVPTLPPPTAIPIKEPALEEASTVAPTESSSADSSSPAAGSKSETAESSSPSATESPTGSEPSSGAAEGNEKSKEPEPEAEGPKKPPKKAIKAHKVYKSAARAGKTVAPPTEEEE